MTETKIISAPLHLDEADYMVKLVFEGEAYVSPEQSLAVLREMARRRAQGVRANYRDLALELGFATPQDLRYTVYLIGHLRVAKGARKPLGYFILEQRMIKPTQLLEALEEQSQIGGRLGEILVRNGWMTDAQVDEALALQKAA